VPDLDAAQHSGGGIDPPQRSGVPAQRLAHGAQDLRRGGLEGFRAAEELADPIIGAQAVLGALPVAHRGAHEEARDREDAEEELHEEQALVQVPGDERPDAPQHGGDRGRGDEERDRGRPAGSEAQRRPHEEGEGEVRGRVLRSRRPAVDDPDEEHEHDADDRRLEDRARLEAEAREVRPHEQEGRDDDRADRVAEPPHDEDRGERGAGLRAAEPQARRADRGADRGRAQRREQHERRDVAEAREGRVEARALEEPGAGDRFGGVARGDAERDEERARGW
jgi:hypothetical protein